MVQPQPRTTAAVRARSATERHGAPRYCAAMRLGPHRSPAVLAAVLLLLAGCGGAGGSSPDAADSSTPSGTASVSGGADVPDVVEVPADAETDPSRHPGDSVDDPAIWVNHDDPAASLVIGNDKQGALETYNLDGSLEQRITAPTAFWGNVDVRQDVRLSTGPVDVVAVANSGLRLYAVDPATRRLTPLTAGGQALPTGGGEGLCLYDSPEGELSVFMVFISGGVIQFVLPDDGSGHLTLEKVREFQVGSEAEGCVVDDANRALYLSEENVGEWRYDADPGAGADRRLVDAVEPKGHQTPDIEGVTLVDDGGGQGLLITSSQAAQDQPSYFSTYDRETGDYLASFRIVDGSGADGCSHTDGIAATTEPLGPEFPEGVFVCQDDANTAPGSSGNQDFKLTRLEKVRPPAR